MCPNPIKALTSLFAAPKQSPAVIPGENQKVDHDGAAQVKLNDGGISGSEVGRVKLSGKKRKITNGVLPGLGL